MALSNPLPHRLFNDRRTRSVALGDVGLFGEGSRPDGIFLPLAFHSVMV